ncbi:hypothetical protein BJY00DRAFT_284778 [Aspergillus carlsbadensis]|nr:hypothetical protein BJY00DRAFT_284778 [Aspergillus carlsbadensis]
MKFTVRKLHHREVTGADEFGLASRGCPVIVAFGRRLRLFYYIKKRDRPSEVETSLPHCVEIAEKCTEEDPNRRLVELMPGDGPVSLDDSKSRGQFERWILSFCTPTREDLTEWNPFTAKHISLKDKDELEA